MDKTKMDTKLYAALNYYFNIPMTPQFFYGTYGTGVTGAIAEVNSYNHEEDRWDQMLRELKAIREMINWKSTVDRKVNSR